MAQLLNAFNYDTPGSGAITMQHGSLTFVGYNIYESISWQTINFIISQQTGANRTWTYSFGLYTLTGSTLSLINSVSGTHNATGSNVQWVSMTATSATSNLTPGTWFFGILVSTHGITSISMYGRGMGNISNAFPGGFHMGAMTASTTALPSAVCTSDLNTTGSVAMAMPSIMLSA